MHTCHLVEPAAEKLAVLGFLPEERGEVDLLLHLSIPGDGDDERRQVAGHSLLARLEEGQKAQEKVLLDIAESLPVTPVLTEIDLLRVPDPELLGLLEEAHRHRVKAQTSAGGAGVPAARWGDRHDSPSE